MQIEIARAMVESKSFTNCAQIIVQCIWTLILALHTHCCLLFSVMLLHHKIDQINSMPGHKVKLYLIECTPERSYSLVFNDHSFEAVL